jgi:hypothetical protein
MNTSSSVVYSDRLKRRIRTGDFREQTGSNWQKALDALRKGDGADAAHLIAYAVDEAKIHCDVMTQWRADLRALLVDKGASQAEVAANDQRLIGLLQLPDGQPFDLPKLWNDFLDLTLAIQGAAYAGEWGKARDLVPLARDAWRMISDRDVDWCCGVMDDLVTRCGEEVVPEMWERVLGPLFNWRYEKFDLDQADWESEILPTLMYVALEAMRAYLSTPKRDGSPLELVEHDDRWVVRFDPCGSGGRSMRGEPLDSVGSRLDPPFNFHVIEGAYAWTDGKPGICVYCNHCQVLMEHWPMDRFGYPLRVVDPPTYPAGDRESGRRTPCEWTIYKDPTAVPEEIYERAGRIKPTAFGSSNQPHGRSAHGGDETTFLGGG